MRTLETPGGRHVSYGWQRPWPSSQAGRCSRSFAATAQCSRSPSASRRATRPTMRRCERFKDGSLLPHPPEAPSMIAPYEPSG